MAVEGSWKAVLFLVCSSIGQANDPPALALVFLAAFQKFPRALRALRAQRAQKRNGSSSGEMSTKVHLNCILKEKRSSHGK